jgi:hypothetical protein
MSNNLELEIEKNVLLQQLELIKGEQISETEFMFLGRCGDPHLINTKLNKTHGIASGQFIGFPDYYDALLVCVGIGKICNSDEPVNSKQVLWFLGRGDDAMFCVDVDNFRELKEKYENLILFE